MGHRRRRSRRLRRRRRKDDGDGRATGVVPVDAGPTLARSRHVLCRLLEFRHVCGVPRSNVARSRLHHVIRYASYQLGLSCPAAVLSARRLRVFLPRQTVSCRKNLHVILLSSDVCGKRVAILCREFIMYSLSSGFSDWDGGVGKSFYSFLSSPSSLPLPLS